MSEKMEGLTRAKVHRQICKEMSDLYEIKNTRYGNSFTILRQDLGKETILVRLGDKYLRLKTLLQNPELSHEDESIEDTLRDLANYCIMELIERRADKYA